MLSTVAQDFRFSMRQFRRTPGFAITAVAVLALGLGANTAISASSMPSSCDPCRIPSRTASSRCSNGIP